MAEELKRVFDPRGGQWNNGRYVPSLVAAIGDVIERHMREIGFLDTDASGSTLLQPAESTPTDWRGFAGPFCRRCNQPGPLKEAGCLTCVHCVVQMQLTVRLTRKPAPAGQPLSQLG